MHAPNRLTLGGLIFLAALACGDETPQWEDIPPITFEPGGRASFDLDDFVNDPDGSDELLLLTLYGGSTSTVRGTVDASTHVVTFTGAPTFEGSVVFEITASDPDGNVGSTLVEVTASDEPVPVGDIPVRSCVTTFSYEASAGVSSVAVAGAFNGWSTTALTLSDGDGDRVFTGGAEIPPGDYPYKLVLNGNQWILDPGTALQAWDGDVLNSAVRVGDCTRPLVRIESASHSAGRVRGTLQYVLGAGQGSLPTGPIQLTVGGVSVPYTLDPETGFASFERAATSPGKYTVVAKGKGSGGAYGEAAFHPLWVEDTPFDWRDAILYFAMTDRFFNGDTGNDDPIAGVGDIANYDGGDWDGIREKIASGYFDDLGVNALWISPIRDNPEWSEYGSDGRLYTGYHGYWPTETGVEGRSGGPEALKALVEEAHDHGIRVMLDLVANHVHDAHPWASEHPDWFNEFDYCGDGGSWDLNPIGCWFTDYLPDLDYRNADALFANLDVSVGLVTEYDLDAVRLDAVKHMEKAFEIDMVAALEAQLEQSGVEIYTVGETFTGPWDQAGYNQGLIVEHIGEGLLDGQFDFPLYWEIVSTFARDEQGFDSLAGMMAAAEGFYGADALMSNFLGNHDIPRFTSHANGDIGDKWGNGAQEQGWVNPPGQPTAAFPYQRIRLAFTFLMTLKGVPLIYYGDEIGLAGAGDPDNRRPMPWGAVSSEQSTTRDHVAALAQLRRAHPAFSRGSHLPIFSDWESLAYGRSAPGDKALVVLHKGAGQRSLNLDVSALGWSNGTALEDALTGQTYTVSGGRVAIIVSPQSGAVLLPVEG